MGLSKIADESVDCVITSPPYWQLRDYGWDGQWGLEPTFQEYLEHLWQMMDEVKRVLKPTGTAWINLGDSYMPHGGSRGNSTLSGSDSLRKNDNLIEVAPMTKREMGNIQSKSLVLIPHRFAIGCIDRGWIVRNDIIWAKRNGMPESVTDRFSKKHEYFFLMVKNENYYFDLDGIRDRHITTTPQIRNKNKEGYNNAGLRGNKFSEGIRDYLHENGKNPGSVSDFWDIPTQPSNESHYATYNTKLIDKPIVAGCPEFVCNKCGKAREKIIKNTPMVIRRSNRRIAMGQPNGTAASGKMVSPAKNEVIGLTDCGCNAGFSGGTILDPFMGTGTTGLRAMELGRNFIGIEGSKQHCDNAVRKFELFKSQQKIPFA